MKKYSVKEVFEAHKKVCAYMGQDGVDYSDFTEIEIIEWVEEVLEYGTEEGKQRIQQLGFDVSDLESMTEGDSDDAN